ncbi:ATP-grasp domain-containing protein [Aurantiacibacter sp. D1-12]|uniref:ATP-grasp domain-containing protein n=1 Tax=Aurantiacibacter sp. D1-12 TaxID=2993658 RepID=UPI00237C7352|nr:hypothetical protein [Aurantiacibacter sp. D1-12]MDE1467722.1 hypothetical protein [Aurantiacibacter sp. D1-12]
MKRIGFLACAETLPGGKDRRGDAFEHDLQVEALRPALASQGLNLVEIDWRAPIEEFDGCALVLLGTAWDYQDHQAEFLARLEELEARGIIICNPPDVVRWNSDKRYLAQLAEAGVSTVPTLWHDDAGCEEILAAMKHFDTDRVVVKRQVGAGGLDQHSFTRAALPERSWRMGKPCMIQPFLPAIVEEGEFSFIFVDGEFSHGVSKHAAEGEYRIQSLFGGTERTFTPSPGDLIRAQGVVNALPFSNPLYARIDMVRVPSGELAVMEAELIEPFLYPEQGPGWGESMVKALAARLQRG